MKNSTRILGGLGAAAVLTLALAGCTGMSGGTASSGSSGGSGGSSAAAGSSASPSSSATPAGDVLSTASTSLGTIVVDGMGLTVYYFDADTKGESTSACTGACATSWPAVLTPSSSPQVDGVTGDIGTIAAAGGERQLTIDGLPVYTYAGDTAPGDVAGQGFGGKWWVVGPDGAKITATAASSGSASAAPSSAPSDTSSSGSGDGW